MNPNHKKEFQLGMRLGTATNRLRKMVMLHLLQKLGLDTCIRCGEKIISAIDLSLDHFENWLDRNVALFWDANNIGFSHRSCNSQARHGKAPVRGCRFCQSSETVKNRKVCINCWNERQRFIMKDRRKRNIAL